MDYLLSLYLGLLCFICLIVYINYAFYNEECSSKEELDKIINKYSILFIVIFIFEIISNIKIFLYFNSINYNFELVLYSSIFIFGVTLLPFNLIINKKQNDLKIELNNESINELIYLLYETKVLLEKNNISIYDENINILEEELISNKNSIKDLKDFLIKMELSIINLKLGIYEECFLQKEKDN